MDQPRKLASNARSSFKPGDSFSSFGNLSFFSTFAGTGSGSAILPVDLLVSIAFLISDAPRSTASFFLVAMHGLDFSFRKHASPRVQLKRHARRLPNCERDPHDLAKCR